MCVRVHVRVSVAGQWGSRLIWRGRGGGGGGALGGGARCWSDFWQGARGFTSQGEEGSGLNPKTPNPKPLCACISRMQRQAQSVTIIPSSSCLLTSSFASMSDILHVHGTTPARFAFNPYHSMWAAGPRSHNNEHSHHHPVTFMPALIFTSSFAPCTYIGLRFLRQSPVGGVCERGHNLLTIKAVRDAAF